MSTCQYNCVPFFYVKVVYDQLNTVSIGDPDNVGTVQVVLIARVAR